MQRLLKPDLGKDEGKALGTARAGVWRRDSGALSSAGTQRSVCAESRDRRRWEGTAMAGLWPHLTPQVAVEKEYLT